MPLPPGQRCREAQAKTRIPIHIFRWNEFPIEFKFPDERELNTVTAANIKLFLRCGFSFAILIAIPALSLAASGPADAGTGALHGYVTTKTESDSTNVPQVVVRSDDGQFREVVATDSTGKFAVSSLSPGRYQVALLESGA